MASRKGLSRREALDIERALVLSKNDEFLLHLTELRELASIPLILNPDTDVWKHEVYVSADSEDGKEGFVEMSDSYFLDRTASSSTRQRVDKVLQEILSHYGLPFYFDDWLRYGLLYRTFPKPPRDDNWFMRRTQGSTAPLAYALDSKEKKMHAVLFRIREGLPLRGRIPKEHHEKYKDFLLSLNQPESKSRRSKVYEDSLKLIDSMKGVLTYELENGQKLEIKKTYRDAVVELYPDEDSEDISTIEEDKRRAARLRQRKHRLGKRSKGFLQ